MTSDSITPTLQRCRIDIRYHEGEIIVSSSGLAKELRWAAQLHGGEQRKREWAIPATKLDAFVRFCAGQGAEVVPHEGVSNAVKVAAKVLDMDYFEMSKQERWKDMYPFQQSGAQFLATYPRAMLLDEMGLGKTIIALMALPSDARGIIVCPASLRLNWKVEGEKWRPDLRFEVCAKPGNACDLGPNNMAIMSPECLSRLCETRSEVLAPQEWHITLDTECAIFDEAHYYKNPKTKRSEAAAWVAKRASICWGLTGTVMTNKPPDVRGVLRTFGLFNSAFATGYFFDRQFGMERDGRTGETTWPADPPHAEEVTRSIERVAIRRLRSEVLPELPPKTWADVVVDISGAKGVDGKRLEIPDTGEEIERVYRAVDKSGTKAVPADWSVIGRTRALVAEAKIPAMLEFVERFVESGTPLVVACYNRAPLDALVKHGGWPVIVGSTSHSGRHHNVNMFQMGAVPIIGIQLQAGGTGITLTRASHMLMVQRDWSPAVNVQAEDRICRIGQEKPVIIYDMWANHPLDQRISRALRDKQTRIATTVGRVGDTAMYGDELVERMRELAAHVDNKVKSLHGTSVPAGVTS